MTLSQDDLDTIQTMITTALQGMPTSNTGLTRNGTVQSYDATARLVTVLVDGDDTAVQMHSTLAVALVEGQRVQVTLQDPHGGQVTGLAGDLISGGAVVPPTVVIEATTSITISAPDVFDAEPWNEVASGVGFENGWTDLGGANPLTQFRKRGRMVDLIGVVTGGSIGFPVFHLPSGYLPPGQMEYPVIISGGGTGQVAINALTGEVRIVNGSTTATAMDISFPLN